MFGFRVNEDKTKQFPLHFQAQCNVFQGATGDVALTAAGGLRELPGGRIENAALVCFSNYILCNLHSFIMAKLFSVFHVWFSKLIEI